MLKIVNPPGGEQVVFELLSVPEDPQNLQDGRTLLLTNIFGPVRRIFAYRKVRKKYYQEKVEQQRTIIFRHFFDHSPPLLPRISSDRLPDISLDFWLEEERLELVVDCMS